MPAKSGKRVSAARTEAKELGAWSLGAASKQQVASRQRSPDGFRLSIGLQSAAGRECFRPPAISAGQRSISDQGERERERERESADWRRIQRRRSIAMAPPSRLRPRGFSLYPPLSLSLSPRLLGNQGPHPDESPHQERPWQWNRADGRRDAGVPFRLARRKPVADSAADPRHAYPARDTRR